MARQVSFLFHLGLKLADSQGTIVALGPRVGAMA